MTIMDCQLFILLAPTLALVIYGIVDHLNMKGGAHESRSRRDYGRDGLRDYPTRHYGWGGGCHNTICTRKRRRPTIRSRWLAVQNAVK